MSLDLAAVKELVIGLAAYYDKKLSPQQIAMYAEDLSTVPIEDLVRSIRLYRSNPKNSFFPLPAKLLESIRPQETAEDCARLAESEIWEAVGAYGWPNANRARSALGALAWEGVERFGGWARVCEGANEDGATFRAQMRNVLESVYRRAQQGRLEERVALPSPDQIPIEVRERLKAIGLHRMEGEK